MKKIFLLSVLFLALKLSASANDLDSLKQKLQFINNDSLKAPVYTAIADEYLQYDTISSRRTKYYYQSEALNYTMMALHLYSRYGDSVGLRVSFDALAKVYYSQRKYSQAKWFNLQSAGISRIKKDIPNLITSLIKLSTIKMEIKDYRLAMRDLNEALSLSVNNKIPQMEVMVQRNYGYLYNRMNDPEKGAIALKRADELQAKLEAQQDMTTMYAIQKFAQDTVVAPADTNIAIMPQKKAIVDVKKPIGKSKKLAIKKIVASI